MTCDSCAYVGIYMYIYDYKHNAQKE